MRFRNRRLLASDRSLPCDILHFSRTIPIARAEISMDLSSVAAIRSATQPRISWAAIFTKAYGATSNQCEWLRLSYFSWPFGHVYRHEQSVASIAIHRDVDGQPRLFWGRLIDPANASLEQIQRQLDHFKLNPASSVFRKQLRVSRLPWPARRLIWWAFLNFSGQARERQLGTFSVSSLAGQGVINRDHPTICTSSLTYGPVNGEGHCVVTLAYDHRLFDGMLATQALQHLRRCLQQDIIAELSRGSHRLRRVAQMRSPAIRLE